MKKYMVFFLGILFFVLIPISSVSAKEGDYININYDSEIITQGMQDNKDFIDYFDGIFDEYLPKQEYNYLVVLNPVMHAPDAVSAVNYCIIQENDDVRDFRVRSHFRVGYVSGVTWHDYNLNARSYCYTEELFRKGYYNDPDKVISFLEKKEFEKSVAPWSDCAYFTDQQLINTDLYGPGKTGYYHHYQFIYKSNVELKIHKVDGAEFYPLKFNNSINTYGVGDRFFTYEEVMYQNILYDKKLEFRAEDIAYFSFTGLNTLKYDLEFKIVYKRDSDTEYAQFDDINFYTRVYASDYSYVDDVSLSGMVLEPYVIENDMQVWHGKIYKDQVYNDGLFSDFWWQFNIANLENLQGTFYVYVKTVPNYGYYLTPKSLANLYRYDIFDSTDILVSPNKQSYTLYVPGNTFIKMKFWKYDIFLKAYDQRILATDLNEDFYYVVPIDLMGDTYLRILSDIKNFTVYSTVSNLHFEKVENNFTNIYDSENNFEHVDIGGSGIDPGENENSLQYFLKMLQNAFSHFHNIIKTIFEIITKIYNNLPLSFRYFIICSFLIFVAFVIMHFV